ncbi:protein kinase [Planctomycetota bacterium]
MGQQKQDKLIGQQVGPYVIREQIGRGGMGVVYKAYEKNLDRMVAVKFLPQHMCADSNYRDRFLNEARAAAKLEHPSIIPVYTAGEYEAQLYIAMQFVKGKTLADMLDQQKVLQTQTGLEVARGVLAALEHAHRRGLVHRDIKPDNIMIDNQGNVKVMDFGLAKISNISGGLTQSGLYLGTPEYSSPEQCATNTLDGRSDIYSLGVVLYECLSGGLPHTAETPLALFNKVTKEHPTPVRVLNTSVPKTVEALIDKMLAKRPDERYQNAPEAIADIDKILAIENFPKTDPSQIAPISKHITVADFDDSRTVAVKYDSQGQAYVPRRRTWVLSAVAVILLAAVLGIIYVAVSSNNNASREDEIVIPQPGDKPGGSGEIPPEIAVHIQPKSVGIVNFENWADDPSLDWMCIAFQDMLATSLGGSDFIKLVPRPKIMRAFADISRSQGDHVAAQSAVIDKLSQHLGLDLIISGRFYQDEEDFRVDVVIQDQEDFYCSTPFTGKKKRFINLVEVMSNDVRVKIETYIREEAEKTFAIKSIGDNDGTQFRSRAVALDHVERAQQCGQDNQVMLAYNTSTEIFPESKKMIRQIIQYKDTKGKSKICIDQKKVVLLLDAVLKDVQTKDGGKLSVVITDRREMKDVELRKRAGASKFVKEQDSEHEDKDDDDGKKVVTDSAGRKPEKAGEMNEKVMDTPSTPNPEKTHREQCREKLKRGIEKKRNLRIPAEAIILSISEKEGGQPDSREMLKNIVVNINNLSTQCASQFDQETLVEFLAKVQALKAKQRDNEAIKCYYRAKTLLSQLEDEELTHGQLGSVLINLYRAFLYQPNYADTTELIQKVEKLHIRAIEKAAAEKQATTK